MGLRIGEERFQRLLRLVRLLDKDPNQTTRQMGEVCGKTKDAIAKDLRLGCHEELALFHHSPDCRFYSPTHYGRYRAGLPVVPTFEVKA